VGAVLDDVRNSLWVDTAVGAVGGFIGVETGCV